MRLEDYLFLVEIGLLIWIVIQGQYVWYYERETFRMNAERFQEAGKMAAGQAATDLEKAERAKDKRLRKKFGITLDEFKRREIEQDFKCAICDGPLRAYGPPHVDHFHFKISLVAHYDDFLQEEHGWDATAFDELGQRKFWAYGVTQKSALASLKLLAMAPRLYAGCCASNAISVSGQSRKCLARRRTQTSFYLSATISENA